MMELWAPYLVLVGFAVLLGVYRYLFDELIESKGDKDFKTALCVRGKLYYVVPADEYLELTRCKHTQDRLSKHFLAAEEYVEKTNTEENK
jgi:hypothetical protein